MATELDKFVESHPEIHHYTSFEGLKGIIETRTLWATNYLYLNDSTETKILMAHIERSLSKRLLSIAERAWVSELDARARNFLELCCDPSEFAYVHAGGLIDALHELAIENRGAYVTSFCSHHADKKYDQTNGILSQWRAYANNGGCCIVFDSKQFANLLRRESTVHYWNFITFEEVTYAEEDDAIEKQFDALISAGEYLVKNLLFFNKPVGFTTSDVVKYLQGASLLKHPGFKEEREVRIVAIPGEKSDVDNARKIYGGVPHRRYKKVHTRNDGSQDIPYLKLFDNIGEELPIKRVIVGPSSQQGVHHRRVIDLLGDRVNVTISSIPFTG